MSEEFRHRTRLDVRFRDVDAFGHVNNSVFLSYIEQGRIAYLAERLGKPISLQAVEELPLILGHLSIDYRSPIFFNQTVEVETRIDWIGRTSFAMSHRLSAGDDRHLVAEASSVLVCYDYTAARPMPVPDDWRSAFETAEGRSLDRTAQGVA